MAVVCISLDKNINLYAGVGTMQLQYRRCHRRRHSNQNQNPNQKIKKEMRKQRKTTKKTSKTTYTTHSPAYDCVGDFSGS